MSDIEEMIGNLNLLLIAEMEQWRTRLDAQNDYEKHFALKRILRIKAVIKWYKLRIIKKIEEV